VVVILSGILIYLFRNKRKETKWKKLSQSLQ
jgi:hypothetical protein